MRRAFRGAHRQRLLGLVLALAVLAVFGGVTTHGFLSFDDPQYVTGNPRVLGGLSGAGVAWALGSFEAANWHPLTWLSHQLDVSLYGTDPRGHHLTSVVLHLANALLLAVLLRRLTGAAWLPWLAAALFALHPLRVESVAWVAERKDVLSGFFFMLTLLAWTKYVRAMDSSNSQGHDPEFHETGNRVMSRNCRGMGTVSGELRGHDPNSGFSEMRIVSREPRGHDPNSGTSEMGIVSPRTVSSAQTKDLSKSLGHDPEFLEDGNRVMSRIFTPNGQAIDSSNSQGHDPGIPRRVMSRIFTPNGQAIDSSNSQGHDPGIPRRVMSRIFTLNRWYVLSLVLFALGLMAKPMLVTLPFVLLLLDFWPLGRPVRRRLAGLLAEKIPFLALAAAASWVTYLAQERGGAVGLMEAHHLAVRLANALLSYVRYLGAFLWPSGLAVFYPFPSSMPPAPKLAGAALFLVVAGFATVRLARRLPAALTGWLWYLGMLVPVLGLVQVGTQAMADRYTYLPGIGLALALSWGLAALTAARPRWRPAVLMLAAVVLVVLVVLGAATRRQAAFWRNDTTLFAHAVVVVGGNPMAHQNLGAALFREGRAAEAEETFRKVLEADPGNAGAHYNLGVIAEAGGRTAEAADHYRRALATNPEDPEAHNNLGTLLAESGDLPGAVDHYRHALRLKPGFAEAHYNLGIDLLALGRRDEGLGHLRQALRLRPDYPDAAARLARETATGVRVDSVP